MSSGGKEGVGRSGSRDWGDLDVFFAKLSGRLTSSRVESVITSLKDEEVSVEDIAQMKTKTLYNFGVVGYEDAKLIVDTAKKHVESPVDLAEATPEEQGVGLMVQQYFYKKVMDVSPSVIDVVCKQLDPGGEGLKTWEHFGEVLLGLSVVEIREFRGYKSGPTKAIIDRKIATHPDATLLDIVQALEEIGRREVVKLLEDKVSSQPPPLAKQSSKSSARPTTREALHLRSQRIPRQGSSSLDSGYDGPVDERNTAVPSQPHPVPPDGPQHSTYQSFPSRSRSQSADSELNNTHHAASISGTSQLSSNSAHTSHSLFHSADSSYSASFEHWESQLPRAQVSTGTGYTTPPQSQAASGTDPQVEYDHFRYSQPQSLVIPAHQPQQPSSKRLGTVSDIEQLHDTFRQMTLAGGQTITLTCNVINATTKTPIPYITAGLGPPHSHTAAEGPVFRDITPGPRLQQFSSSAVPIGTEIQVTIKADTSCYLYILNIGSSGNVTILLPNEYQRDNFLSVGRTYTLPADDYSLRISGPAGKEVIQVMAFSRRLDDLPAMAQPPSGQVLRNIELVQQNLESYERWGCAQMEFLVVTS